MKKTAFIPALLLISILSLTGCKTMGKKVYPAYDTVQVGVTGSQLTVAPGDSVLGVSHAEYSKELHLKNFCEGDGTGNSLDFPAGRYGSCRTCLEADEKYWYFYYPEIQHLGGLGFGQPARAGFRINKQDYSDYQALTPSDIGYAGFDLSPAPVYEVVDMFSVDKPYHQKTITFVSFADDILTLKYEERKNDSGGQENEVKEELTLQFDLLESKDIKIKEARFHVDEAGPDKLVVTINRGLRL